MLQAEPGAGKSTALPLNLLGAPWLNGKKILMLEPRRVAAKAIAHYLAQQLTEKVGQRVGYQIKNERKVSKDTVLEIVTEGILTRRLQNDPEISDVGLIIFDEFHERSLHADLALLLSIEIQQTLREDIKLLVMSATMDTDMVSAYLGGAKIIRCSGTMFPVSLEYTGMSREPLPLKVTKALHNALEMDSDGDVLIFLPGQADIHKSISESRKIISSKNIELLPLYGGLSLTEQEKVLRKKPSGKRRVIFSTNIAETSLTIEGVTCIIDSGLEKILLFDPSSNMSRLETSYISKASANQRMGRAGRIQEGKCIRLWDKQRQTTLKDYQDDEIMRSDLSDLALELAQWGQTNYDNIHWLTPPPENHFDSAWNLLLQLGLTDNKRSLTTLGKKALQIGLSPRLSTMLLLAEDPTEKIIAAEIATLLSERDLFHKSNTVDIVERLLAIQDYKADRKSALKNHPIIASTIEQFSKNIKVLERTLNIKNMGTTTTLSTLQNTTEKLLLYAYPDRLAKRRSDSCSRYLLANGKGVFLPEGDPLFGNDWLVVADCDGKKTEGRIYSAATVTYKMILKTLKTHFTEEIQYKYDRENQRVIGYVSKKYKKIDIIKTSAEITPEIFKRCLIDLFPEIGLNILNWTKADEEWLARTRWLGDQLPDFPTISKDILLNTVDSWLIPYLSNTRNISDLKNVKLFDLLSNILSWKEKKVLDSEAPTHYRTPSGRSIPITYSENQGPLVSVQLQEMFGEIKSPKIGKNQIAIRFELLSPARRPIQTTSDLNHFWQNSYYEVAKEMRGKYPKHRWPDQPLLEKPGRSIKRQH